ncbi:MAG: hypothetical protein WDZ49_00660 [Litorilinea sp.]
MSRAFALLLILLVALTVTACGGNTPPAPAGGEEIIDTPASESPVEESAPATTPGATAASAESDDTGETPDADPNAEATADATIAENGAENGEENGDAEAESTPSPESSATPAVPNGTAVLTPLIVDETPTECEIESNLDLAGYMDIETRMGCARAPAKFDPVAINEFGPGPDYNGFMLWFGSEGNIYVLLPDGTYQVFPDEWQEGDATFTCNPLEGEADSPPLPRRGFGKIWCENPEFQEALGLVEREERLCQHAVDQPFEQGRLIACFEDASVRYFRIMDDGTWHVTTQ